MWNPDDRRPARLPADHPPVLTVIVDTEEEFDWGKPFSRDNVATTSIASQTVAHDRIYRPLGIVPTYVIDYPVATSAMAHATLGSLQQRGECEIGTHLHPWVSPPHDELVSTFNSYAGNLPHELEFKKLHQLTEAIEINFGRRPTTFKAGRYGLGKASFNSLFKLGYKIDASVVPHTSFTKDGGPDFSEFACDPFLVSNGSRQLLELPVTTGFCGFLKDYGKNIFPKLNSPTGKALRLAGISARLSALERIRLTPEGCTTAELIRVTDSLLDSGLKTFSLTYHSPSLAPGHTPYVRSADDLEKFLTTIQSYCGNFQRLGGVFLSLTELHHRLTTDTDTQTTSPASAAHV